MKKYSGIDLHSNNCVIAVLDEQDRVLCNQRVANDLSTILSRLEPHRAELAGIAVESTFNWYWLVDGLVGAGYPVNLVNTAAIAQYEGLKYSGDEHDARHLAHLLRLGLLRFGYVIAPGWRDVRDLARRRAQLVRVRTQHVLALQTQWARQTGGSLKGDTAKRLQMEDVARWGWSVDATFAAQASVQAIRTTESLVTQLEQRLRERVKLAPAYHVLNTIPGVGEVLSTVIMLETGPIERFAATGNYASYARCVCSKRESNHKKKGEGNRKNGNAYLAWAFVEAAHGALRYCQEAQRFYERKKARTNGAVATKALAHKLARAVYHMLKEQTTFDAKRCFA